MKSVGNDVAEAPHSRQQAGADLTFPLDLLRLPDTAQNVLMLFRRQAAARPGADAIQDAAGALSYAQVDSRSDAIARALIAGGAGPGTIVALALDAPRHHILALLGCLKAGCVFAPMDLLQPARRLQSMLAVADARWFVLDAAGLPRAEPLLRSTQADWLLLDGEVAEAPPGVRIHHPLEAGAKPAEDAASEDPCYLFFTSGSTGTPKAVLGRTGGLAHFVQWEIDAFGLGPGCRVSQLTGPTFDVSLRDILVPLCAGGTACIPPGRPPSDPATLVRWLEEARIEWIHAVPSLFRLLLDEPLAATSLPALRAVLLAGEALPPADANRWIQLFGDRIRLVNLYGPTETTLAKFFHVLPHMPIAEGLVPVGRPIPGAQAILLDEGLAPTPPGEAGEIFIRTPYRSLGYFGDPEATDAAFVPNPATGEAEDRLYRTGDIGRVLDNGDFVVCGRRDSQVKWRGVRVDLAEIEARLRERPGIRDAAVLLREDTPGDPRLVAYHAPARGADPAGPEHLRAYLLEWFPANLVPACYVALARFPLSPNGKLDRRALPPPPPALDASELDPASNGIEAIVREAYAAVLGRERVGPHDDLFLLGADSIAVQRLRGRLREHLTGDVGTRLLFTCTTPASLANALIDRGAGISRP